MAAEDGVVRGGQRAGRSGRGRQRGGRAWGRADLARGEPDSVSTRRRSASSSASADGGDLVGAGSPAIDDRG